MIREQATHKTVKQIHSAAITSDTTTYSTAVDTKEALAVDFSIGVPDYTDGTYVVTFVEGESTNLSVSGIAVDSSSLVYGDAISLSAATSDGDSLTKEGLVGTTKRYVGAKVVSTSTSSGATLNILASVEKDVNPTDQDG